MYGGQPSTGGRGGYDTRYAPPNSMPPPNPSYRSNQQQYSDPGSYSYSTPLAEVGYRIDPSNPQPPRNVPGPSYTQGGVQVQGQGQPPTGYGRGTYYPPPAGQATAPQGQYPPSQDYYGRGAYIYRHSTPSSPHKR
jgi:hypothetical protein